VTSHRNRFRHISNRVLRGKSLRETLLRGGAGSFLTKGLQAVVALFLTIVLARVLGPEQFGIYSFVLAALMLAAIPTQVGAPQLLVRETAKYAVSQDWSRVHGLWRWANRLVLGFSLGVIIVLAATLWLFGDRVEPATLYTTIIGSALIPLIALANLRAASLRGLKHVVIGQLPEKIVRPTALLLFVLVTAIFSLEEPITAKSVMAMHVVAAVLAFLIGWALLVRNVTARTAAQFHPIDDRAAWRKAILPLSMITGFQLVNSHLDIVILGIFRDSEEVGVYRVVTQLAISLLFALNALQMVVQPYFSEFYTSGERARLQKLVTMSSNILLLVSILASVVLIIFPGFLLSMLFGEEYREGAIALQVLVAGLVFKAVLGFGATLLMMAGQEHLTMKITGIAAASNIILNLILVPSFGMLGAAVSTALTFIGWSMWLRLQCKRSLGVEIFPQLK